MTARDVPIISEPPRAREVTALLVVCALGLVARAWSIGSVGLGQYDEGVYATSGWGLSDPSQGFTLWPMQERFSPPVFITLVSLAFRLAGGPSDTAAVWVNVVLGTATIPAVWWVSRRWLGGLAALVAATLVAGSEFHIILSRSALTDVTFTLVFLLAVGAVASVLDTGGWRRAVVAGVLVGLAWNTKYHGWFAIVIGAGALVGWWWFGGADRRLVPSRARDLAVAAVIAGLLYLPWMLHVQGQPGTVTGWTSYFAGMVSIRWPQNVVAHALQQWYLEGPVARAAVPIALGVAAVSSGRVFASGRAVLLAGASVVLAATLGAMAVTMLLALTGTWMLLQRRDRVANWVWLGWFALWIVAAPMYRPYFRLLLPLLIVGSMLAGVAVAQLLTSAGAHRRVMWVQAWMAGLATVLVVLVARWLPDASDPWRPTSEMREVAARISAQMPAGAPVTVIGEPTLVFYLRRLGHPSLGDVTSGPALDALDTPRYVVTGVYARRAPALREALATRAIQLQFIARERMTPTEIRLLDDFSPSAARAYRIAPDSTYDLLLYSYGAAPLVP